MFYTIYQTINRIDGKIYIGKHQTENLEDGYLGSGKHLKRAIEKYGLENFEKTILHVFDNEGDMNQKESELVTEEFCNRQDTYNICPGGKGGWGYVNGNNNQNFMEKQKKTMKKNMLKKYGVTSVMKLKHVKEKLKKTIFEKYGPDQFSNIGKLGAISTSIQFPNGIFYGKKHTQETKAKMSGPRPTQSGSGNSQYGTMWITNGTKNRKIKKVDNIPEGWYKGRVIKN